MSLRRKVAGLVASAAIAVGAAAACTPPPVPPGTPVPLNISKDAPRHSATVTFAQPRGANPGLYRVSRDGTDDNGSGFWAGDLACPGNLGPCSMTWTHLVPGQTYHLRVQARNASGAGASLTVTVKLPIPGPIATNIDLTGETADNPLNYAGYAFGRMQLSYNLTGALPPPRVGGYYVETWVTATRSFGCVDQFGEYTDIPSLRRVLTSAAVYKPMQYYQVIPQDARIVTGRTFNLSDVPAFGCADGGSPAQGAIALTNAQARIYLGQNGTLIATVPIPGSDLAIGDF